ncbi:MAG: BMP family ABC transporter substrate-binding protein [Methanocorpusculum sp.]|nr:BMP family ABC transporter substrate-binding protein [Methanocorpusculum sp.]
MNKRNLPTIIIIILIIGFAFYVFSADTIFAKEEEKYQVELLTVLTTAYDPFNTQAMMGVYFAERSGIADAEFTLIGDDAGLADYFKKTALKNPNLICGVGFTLQESMYNSALENPNIDYLTVDMTYTEDDIPGNMANIIFRSNEASYVAGYVAGMTTETNKIGFVGGMNTSIIQGFYYGFMAGISRAEITKLKKINVSLEYADSYIDPYTGAEIAEKMYNDGVDIIYSVAGVTGNGVISTAAVKNKYVIGVDTDQNYMAPENVIFSVIKKIDTSINTTIADYAAGKKHGGEVISLGYAENGVDVVNYLDCIDPKVIEEADFLKEDIKTGRIIVPYTKEEYEDYLHREL